MKREFFLPLLVVMSLLVVLISAVSCQKQNKEYDAKITDL